MPAGRPRKPTALKLLDGTYRKDRDGNVQDEVKPDKPKRLTAPSHLGRKGKAVWRRLGPMLQRLGLLTEADTEAFASYCRQHDLWHAAIEAMNADPSDMNAFRRHQSATDQIHRLGSKFGLTPSDRNGLTTEVSRAKPTVTKARKRG